MTEASNFIVFLSAALALLLVPGPAVMYIVARSVDEGRRAGLASTLGIGAGTLVHVAAAAFGVSALLVSSALAFSVVKYAGAAYLIGLGLMRLFGREKNGPAAAPSRANGSPLRRAFLQGVVVNALNPKTALFFLAFLPQFVDPARGVVWAQVVALGLTFIGLGMLTDGLWAMGAGTASRWLRGHARFLRAQRYVSGGTYVALGVAAAASRKP